MVLVGFYPAGPRLNVARPVGLIESGQLLDAALVPAALEVRGEEHLERGHRRVGLREPLPEAGHVGVVVPAGDLGVRDVADDAAAHARHLVGRHADALPAPAHGDPSVDLAAGDRLPDQGAVVRVVDAVLAVGADVRHLVAVVEQPLPEGLLQQEARVVRADRDPHEPSRDVARSTILARRPASSSIAVGSGVTTAVRPGGRGLLARPAASSAAPTTAESGASVTARVRPDASASS